MNIALERFEKLTFEIANEVLAQLSAELRTDAEQVILEVVDYPGSDHLEAVEPGYTLLGLYQGVPLIRRRPDTILLQPDRITLFRGSISARCRTEVELKTQIRKTLIHELGHYFGFNEEELRQRGWA